MADNYANPLKEAETDIQRATKTISGLLNPDENKKQTQEDGEPPQEEQNSPGPYRS